MDGPSRREPGAFSRSFNGCFGGCLGIVAAGAAIVFVLALLGKALGG